MTFQLERTASAWLAEQHLFRPAAKDGGGDISVEIECQHQRGQSNEHTSSNWQYSGIGTQGQWAHVSKTSCHQTTTIQCKGSLVDALAGEKHSLGEVVDEFDNLTEEDLAEEATDMSLPMLENALDFLDADSRRVFVTRDRRDAHFQAFMRAARTGDKKAFVQLMDKGHDVNASTCGGKVLLSEIIKIRRDLALELLKRKDIDVHQKDIAGRTPLWYAVNNQAAGIAKELLDRGADANISVNDQPALLYSLRRAYASPQVPPLVKTFIDRGADPNCSDGKGRTPLSVALDTKQYAAARVLIENGARIAPRDLSRILICDDAALRALGERRAGPQSRTFDPALAFETAIRGDYGQTLASIQRGADVLHYRHPEKKKSLLAFLVAGYLDQTGAQKPAARAGKREGIEKALIAIARRYGGILPGYEARAQTNPDLKTILDKARGAGASPGDGRAAPQKDPLTEAERRELATETMVLAFTQNKPELARALVAAGDRIGSSHELREILRKVLYGNQLDWLELFLAAGLDPDMEVEGRALLTRVRSLEALQLLVKYNVRLAIAQPPAETLLFKVIRSVYLEEQEMRRVLAYLLEQGLDPNVRYHQQASKRTYRPLDWVIAHVHDAALVKILLDAGARTDYRVEYAKSGASKSHTPLSLAREKYKQLSQARGPYASRRKANQMEEIIHLLEKAAGKAAQAYEAYGTPARMLTRQAAPLPYSTTRARS